MDGEPHNSGREWEEVGAGGRLGKGSSGLSGHCPQKEDQGLYRFQQVRSGTSFCLSGQPYEWPPTLTPSQVQP